MPSAPRRFASIFVVHVVREIRGLPLTSQGLVERERMIRITTTPVAVSRGFFMSRGLRVNYGPMGEEFFAEFGHDAIGTISTPTTVHPQPRRSRCGQARGPGPLLTPGSLVSVIFTLEHDRPDVPHRQRRMCDER